MTAAAGDAVWSAADTTPGEVDEALRRLVHERHAENAGWVPARALNLVCVVDREWSGEIANRLSRVGRFHASRTVICAVEPARRTLDARASVASPSAPAPGAFAPLRETVVLSVGEEHLDDLGTLVGPLVVSDLATVAWSPHGHDAAGDSLARLAQVMLHDSVDAPDAAEGLARAAALARRAYVVDLAWLRSTPWRERVAAAFDPVAVRDELGRIAAVTIRHQAASASVGLLVLGWLSSRLGWRPGSLGPSSAALAGTARAAHGEVAVRLEPAVQEVPGLAGITLGLEGGTELSLDRAPGGLLAHRRDPDGGERTWTALGASRGEGGILGEGIRQALLRDPTYAPALRCALGFAPS